MERGRGINVRALAIVGSLVYYIAKTIAVGILITPGDGVVLRFLDLVPTVSWAWVAGDGRIIGVEWLAVVMTLFDVVVLVALIVLFKKTSGSASGNQ